MDSDKRMGEHPAPSRLSRTARIRERADTALYFGSNRMALIVSLFTVMLFCYGCASLGRIFASLFAFFVPALSDAMRYVLLCGFLYLFLSPLWSGLLGYAYDLYRTAQGELSGRVPATELFSCYATLPMLVRAWILTALQCVLFALPVASTCAVFRCLPRAFARLSETESAVNAVLTPVVAVFVVLCTLYLTVCLSPALFLSVTRPDLGVHRCLAAAFLRMQPYAAQAIFSVVKFCFLSILSFLLAGIPFFLYLLPHAILTYISLSKELSNSIPI